MIQAGDTACWKFNRSSGICVAADLLIHDLALQVLKRDNPP